MRAVKVKRLRREARELAKGQPDVSYDHPGHAPLFRNHDTTGKVVKEHPGVPRMLGYCTKAALKILKKSRV